MTQCLGGEAEEFILRLFVCYLGTLKSSYQNSHASFVLEWGSHVVGVDTRVAVKA